MIRIAALLLFCGLSLHWGCGKGGFQNQRDNFQSIYGLDPVPVGLMGSSFVGRIVDRNGNAVPFARIHLKGSLAYTTSNQKGGFLLTGLIDAHNTVYITDEKDQGKTLEIDLDPSRLNENQHIVLEEMRRFSGRVRLRNLSVSDARISMEGSPFSTVSNERGEFALKLPPGDYRLKVQHILYAPYEIESLSIRSDEVQDIELESLALPSVDVSIDKVEDGSIVRGMKTTLLLQKSSTVRYMRITSKSLRVVTDFSLGIWVDIQESLVLDHKEAGPSWIRMQFMDQFGKMTDPVQISYYNTNYDASWRLVSRSTKQPLLVNRNEKVAFLNASDDFVLSGPVEVEAGAVIRGSRAMFKGPVQLKGTAEDPIIWDLRDEAGQSGELPFVTNRLSMNYAHLSNGTLILNNVDRKYAPDDRWTFANSVFENIDLKFSLTSFPGRFFSTEVDSCRLRDSGLVIIFWNGQSSQVETTAPQDSKPGKVTVSIKGNDFQVSKVDYLSSGRDEEVTFDKNNFFGSARSSYLSLTTNILKEGSPKKLLMGENYFEFQESIVDDFDRWAPVLGEIAKQPIAR